MIDTLTVEQEAMLAQVRVTPPISRSRSSTETSR